MIDLINKQKDIIEINKIGNHLKTILNKNDIVLITAPYSIEIRQFILALTKLGITFSIINNLSKNKDKIIKELNPKIIINKKEDVLYSENESTLKRINFKKRLCILFSSGTTGVPKGIELSREGMFTSASNFAKFFKPKGKIIVFPEIETVSGLRNKIFLPLFSDIEITEKTKFKNILDLSNFIKKENINFISCSPILIKEIIKNKEFLSFKKELKIVSSGEELFLEDVKTIYEKFKVKVFNNYGLTETIAGSLFTNPKKKEHIGTMGIPVDCEAKIEKGELLLKGKHIMKGYFKNKEETEKTIKDNWLYTGDLVEEKEGIFYIKGRKKNLIVSAGYSIYPEEINEVLLKMPGILDSAIIGIPHKIKEEEIAACIVTKNTKEEISSYLKENLVQYKIPTKLFFVEKIEKTITGKINYSKLKEEINGRKNI